MHCAPNGGNKLPCLNLRNRKTVSHTTLVKLLEFGQKYNGKYNDMLILPSYYV